MKQLGVQYNQEHFQVPGLFPCAPYGAMQTWQELVNWSFLSLYLWHDFCCIDDWLCCYGIQNMSVFLSSSSRLVAAIQTSLIVHQTLFLVNWSIWSTETCVCPSGSTEWWNIIVKMYGNMISLCTNSLVLGLYICVVGLGQECDRFLVFYSHAGYCKCAMWYSMFRWKSHYTWVQNCCFKKYGTLWKKKVLAFYLAQHGVSICWKWSSSGTMYLQMLQWVSGIAIRSAELLTTDLRNVICLLSVLVKFEGVHMIWW